jgi:hypothetical protein
MAITRLRGGGQITDGTIPYADIQNVTANTILGNNTASAASIQEIALATSTLLGRGVTGNISAITAGTGLAFSGSSIAVSANLASLSGLTYGTAAAFVKMTAAGTFALDTNTYLTAETDTLASVTGRAGGATTSTPIILQGNLAAWNATTPGTGTGGLHLGAASSTTDYGSAITFGARDSSSGLTGQAGIYVISGGNFGTAMYIATTDAYVSGSKTAISISNGGLVNFVRSRPTALGNTILDAGNYASYSTFSGTVTSGGNNGFSNATYSSGVRNPIWYFGNATTYGISYFQGTSGIGSADTIGIHPNGTATAAGSAFSVTPTNSYINNNIVWHAGNLTNLNQLTNGPGYITAAQTYYIGTTSNALNRSSGAQTLTGVSIDGTASAATRLSFQSPSSVDSASTAGYLEYFDATGATGAPASGWYSYLSLRHQNSANLNGFQLAYAFGGSSLSFRGSNGTNYLTWYTLYHTGNLTLSTLGGQAQLNGTGFVKASGTTISYDNTSYLPLTGGTMTGNIIMATATSPNTYYLQFGDNSGWFYRFMTNVSGTPTVRFSFKDNGDFTAVGAISGTYVTATGTNGWTMGNVAGSARMQYSAGVFTVLNTSNANADFNAGTITGSGDVIAYSDARVKTNVKTIDNALEKVLALRGVSYTRIDTDDTAEKIGVIAQEIQKIIPQVVKENENGILGVSYGNLAGVFIEAFKDQQKQIEELKQIIEELKR